MFTVRFPNAQLIKDWNRFNPISLRIVKAKIMIESWNGSVGAKGELQQAWFRVKGVPYDLRSEETMAYVGSLVGSTREVDKATLNRSDYVRIKLAARDVTKVPSVVEGTIDLYLYDFFFEREVVEESAPKKDAAQIQSNGTEGAASSVKLDIVIRDPSSSNQTQHVESQSSMDGDTSKLKGVVQQPVLDRMGAQLAPSKVAKTLTESVNMDGKENKLGVVLEVDETDPENGYDNRVQGLSGNNMMESEDDMLSDELHEGCDDQKVAYAKLNIGLVKCSELIMHQTEEKAIEGGNLAKEKEMEDKTEVAVKSQALIISKK
jgi:hypothetical protein